MSARISRDARRRQRQFSPLLKYAFRQLRHPYAPLELWGPAEMESIHQASLHILENIGLDFLDAEVLAIWERAGAAARV
jgi:trimethylamine---corrinoid protein Co-methyltransferase